ncbi:MAG: hypothetical protein FJ207_05670 [Gemmatimonadetes bacterium]|nr:hypothetical protein [Gemmatimonadota bacterium]
MRLPYTPLALFAIALGGCAQNPAPAASTGSSTAASSDPAADWVARAAAAVRVSDDPYDLRDCEFVSVLSVPGGWDGELKSMTPAEVNALNEMKVATVRAGGNFVLLYPGPEASGEAYLCTE